MIEDSDIHLLKHASRYIDDLNVPNIDSGICESICYDIYTYELVIVSTSTSSSNTLFLDLGISVIDDKLYDKHRNFGFKFMTFPNLRFNIPNKNSRGTIIGELCRTCKFSTRYEDFIHVKLSINKLFNQKFKKSLLHSFLNRFLPGKPESLSIGTVLTGQNLCKHSDDVLSISPLHSNFFLPFPTVSVLVPLFILALAFEQ